MSTTSAAAKEILSILRGLEFTRANELARRGKLIGAESLVTDVLLDPKYVKVATDLLARIRVQQGRLIEAQKLWMDLIRLNANDDRSKRAVVATKKLIDWGQWYGISRILLVLACGVVLIAGVTMAARNHIRGIRTSAGETVHASMGNPLSGTSASQTKVLDLGLNVPGAVVREGEAEDEVNFESGLFTEGTILRPAAARILEDLARQLGPNSERIEVIVEGHTDCLPVFKGSRFRDNFDLADARAEVVSLFLIRFGRISARHIFLQSGTPAPFPNEAVDGETRNRTVGLRIRIVPQ
jgi:outer membrane protein OmpA-like peptidoglycan-associated protein